MVLLKDQGFQYLKVILQLYAQLIDDINGHTLTYANSKELGKAKM